MFRLLDWGDRIGLRLREDGQVRRQGEGLAGVAEADDLAVRAARLLKDVANVVQGADIIVENTFLQEVALAAVRPTRPPCWWC